MKVLAYIELTVAILIIILNPILKLGWRLREGSLNVGRSFQALLTRSDDEHWQKLAKWSLISEKTLRQLLQCFIYVFGCLSIFIAIYYLIQEEWLVNAYVILAAFFWLGVLSALPSKKERRGISTHE
jgi:hypothetical protein